MVLLLGNVKAWLNQGKLFTELPVRAIESVEQAIAEDLVQQATVLAIVPSSVSPVQQIQKAYAADRQLSVVVLAEPARVRQIKQGIMFAPNIGKNTLVVSLTPELNIENVCKTASVRTIQKRSFHKLNLSARVLSTGTEKIKLSQLGTFLEYAPVTALVISETGAIINGNQQAKKLFPSLAFPGEHLAGYFPISQAQAITAFIHSKHAPESTIDIQLPNKILELSATEVYTDDTEGHYLLLMSDVTHQRKEMVRIRSIMEALPQMAWTANPEGLVTYLNNGWYLYTGQAAHEALDMGWVAVLHPEDANKLTEQWNRSVVSGVPFQQAARYRQANGAYRWHLTRGSAIRNHTSEIIMWVGTCTDIHDQILLTEELEIKVKERTHSLELTNSELEQFAHVSSHDLQEPLRKIKIFSGLLKEQLYESADETSKKYMDKISDTAERMSWSLKALLNYTHLRSEEKFGPVDLNDIVSQVLTDLELLISQKNAVIRIKNLPVINGAAIQMQQLFYNLINNALKFSRKEVAPEIEITARVLSEEKLTGYPDLRRFRAYHEIIVKDNGVGFEQKYAEQIFTIFQRLHSKSEFEGTGIGLSLVKKVAANHGGEVIAKSTVGKGTSIYLVLPA